MNNPRDYGLGASPEPASPAEITRTLDQKCPNCESETLFMLRIKLKDEGSAQLLKGTRSPVGEYIGCAACPFASPMVMKRQ
jgi:DNA-directed RNA polymerase subunit RPC12/RpoP